MAKKKDKTLMFIIGGAAVAGLAWWWLSRPKTVVSPVYRVVSNPQTVSPVAADITAAGNAAADIINASNNSGSGNVQVPQGLKTVYAGDGTSGSGSQMPDVMDTFPGSVYSVNTSRSIAGAGLYGDGSE